jgi:hypothetical protein
MKILVDAFLAQVEEALHPLGFRYIRSRRSFERRFDGGKQALHLSLNLYRDEFYVAADVAIRFNVLEDLLNANDTSLSQRAKAVTYSIGCELGNLVYGDYKRWTVQDADGGATVAGAVSDFFIEHGLPYFDRYSSLPAAFALIAPHPERICLHQPFLVTRAKYVVALAVLLGEQNALASLVPAYEAALRSHRPAEMDAFRTFVMQQLGHSAQDFMHLQLG